MNLEFQNSKFKIQDLTPTHMILTVHVKPNAKHNSIEWIDADTAKIHVRAVAEKGRANEAVIGLLSKKLNKPKSCIFLKRGQTTRIKQIEII